MEPASATARTLARSASEGQQPLVVGTVVYLNSRPLTCGLAEEAADVRIVSDLPSRLAERLAAGELDAALVPSITAFCRHDCLVISDACVACDGPVRSVKLFFRVPPPQIRRLALDEGSRTSAALARILLAERFALRPQLQPLAIGDDGRHSGADAVLLIGDRCMRAEPGCWSETWDLGVEWHSWTGLPFVFAVWMARPGRAAHRLGRLLSAARDRGRTRLAEIARREAPQVGLPEDQCLTYLRDELRFFLGPRERQALQRFYDLAERHGLAPPGVQLVFADHRAAG